ncbi:hypothetical protein B7494_g5433 [Chlorociboria aeruginascens]|nr:hypothetical protein B7494_g5433 [Chlorociboria aeruginascens]
MFQLLSRRQLGTLALLILTLFILSQSRRIPDLSRLQNSAYLQAFLKNTTLPPPPLISQICAIQTATPQSCSCPLAPTSTCPPQVPVPIPSEKPLSCPTQHAIPCIPQAIALPPPPPILTKEQQVIASLRASGIVVIFKTGAQEVSQLSIHLGTTLRHLNEQDILIFSDQQGSIGPFAITDALRNVDQKIRESDPDFEIYRAIRTFQSTGQDIEDLKEDKSKGNGRSGWRLDKYKFIHMVEEAFQQRPDAKWYVFIETDSYVIWSNLVEWLGRLDSTKATYLGAPVYISRQAFGHGGSGYVLSNAAMNRLLGPEQPQGVAASWDKRMKDKCCGDYALGIALTEKGVNVTNARPLLNGFKPTTLPYGPKAHWCQPVVTMHHLLPHEVSAIWRFERRREILGNTQAATFSELYTQFVEPHLMSSRENWDNLSDGPTYREPSLEEKQAAEKAQAILRAGEEAKTEDAEQKKMKEIAALEETARKVREQEGVALGMNTTLPPQGTAQSQQKQNEHKNQTSNVERQKPAPNLRKRSTAAAEPQTEEEAHAFESFGKCGAACEANHKCFQYLYYEKTCVLSTAVRLGAYRAVEEGGGGVFRSGWMVDRIRTWKDANWCEGPKWP